MTSTAHVCPFCGEPPGDGVFCAACGRNLAAVERLPTRAEWEAKSGPGGTAAAPGSTPPPPAGIAAAAAGSGSPAERCAAATAAFLEAMRAAGSPGTTRLAVPGAKSGIFRRTPELEGWVMRAVAWDDRDMPHHHEPGLLLTTDGAFHRIDSEIRGWGQRVFPVFHDTAAAEPLPPPEDEGLIGDLDALLREHGVEAQPTA